MFGIRWFYAFALAFISCGLIFSSIAIATEPALSGEFPFENVEAVYSGPFMQPDHDDLWVVQRAGGISFGHDAIVGLKLALYIFDGKEFRKKWECGSIILDRSIPGLKPIPATAWCYGDFDRDGKYSLVTCSVRNMHEYKFYADTMEQFRRRLSGRIKTPDIWIVQMIACDIDNDSCDEIVAMEFPDMHDTCCTTIGGTQCHTGIYKLVGDSLAEVWHGLTGETGFYYTEFPPTKIISKCLIDWIPGEVPVLKGTQSDVSPSHYSVIGSSPSGGYERLCPFPYTPAEYIKKGDRRAEESGRPRQQAFGPVGGIIFNDGINVLHYGYFIDYSRPDRQRPDPRTLAVLEDDHWRLLRKHDPSIGGELCKFTVEPGRTGWLFIKDGKYSFYDKLPVEY